MIAPDDRNALELPCRRGRRIGRKEVGRASGTIVVGRNGSLKEGELFYGQDKREGLDKLRRAGLSPILVSVERAVSPPSKKGKVREWWEDTYQVSIPRGQTWGECARIVASAGLGELRWGLGKESRQGAGGGGKELLAAARKRRESAFRKLAEQVLSAPQMLNAAWLRAFDIPSAQFLLSLPPSKTYESGEYQGIPLVHAGFAGGQGGDTGNVTGERGRIKLWGLLCRRWIGFAEVFHYLYSRMEEEGTERSVRAIIRLDEWISSQAPAPQVWEDDNPAGFDNWQPENIVFPENWESFILPYGEAPKPVQYPAFENPVIDPVTRKRK